MKICPSCGSHIYDTAQACPYCGTVQLQAYYTYQQPAPPPVPVQYCPYCGASHAAGAYICHQCERRQPNTPGYSFLPPLSFKQWLGTLFLLCIPVVNIIMLCIWAFDNSSVPEKKNWAKARLIIVGIVFLLNLLTSSLWSSFYLSLLRSLTRWY